MAVATRSYSFRNAEVVALGKKLMVLEFSLHYKVKSACRNLGSPLMYIDIAQTMFSDNQPLVQGRRHQGQKDINLYCKLCLKI